MPGKVLGAVMSTADVGVFWYFFQVCLLYRKAQVIWRATPPLYVLVSCGSKLLTTRTHRTPLKDLPGFWWSESCIAGSGLLLANYIGAITYALQQPGVFRLPVMVGAHALLAILLAVETRALDQSKYTQEGIAKYYRGIWNLFYSEYALLPFL
jgi:hypothetical protein